MADFVEANFGGNLELDLSKFEKAIKEKVLFSGAATMADVIADEVKLNVSPPRMGKKTGNLASSIYWAHSPERSTDGRVTYRVSWNKSKAPHGHLLEWGTSRMPAHPFIRPAFDHVNEAIRAGTDRMKERLKEITG